MNEKSPVVEQCRVAGILLVSDPKDKEKKIEQRIPCKRIDGDYCSAYLWPDKKWRVHACPLADRMVGEEDGKKINPLKASKRAAGKKA